MCQLQAKAKQMQKQKQSKSKCKPPLHVTPSLSLSICNIRPSGTRPSLSLITSGSGSFGVHFGDGNGVCKFSIAKSQRPHCLVYPKLHCKLLYSQRPHCKLYSQRPHHLVYPRFSVMHSAHRNTCQLSFCIYLCSSLATQSKANAKQGKAKRNKTSQSKNKAKAKQGKAKAKQSKAK